MINCSHSTASFPGLQSSRVPCRNSGTQAPATLLFYPPPTAESIYTQSKVLGASVAQLEGVSLGLHPGKCPSLPLTCRWGEFSPLGHPWRLGSVISSLMVMYPVPAHSLWKRERADLREQLRVCSTQFN